MAEYTVKVGFWVWAFDGFTVEADSDEAAIEKAKAAAHETMESRAWPEHIDHVTPGDHRVVAEDVAFESDRIHPAPEA
ncbi:hypothetical protein D3P06_00825 [Paracoccus aestuarii]|uniref:Uncharacterized protein n=1 Tax=Paracoccus aestuarii TaxID=453842 RepID=A0A419A2P2_9RHOB|nr:hypothetical protein [Paracoccus aestuarii]RJL07315.1 hypothetical protein D3P06_00825 [Paracoccus aestuarii]WCR00062.1 hypothetical protein JHW48_04965 [Paracoccus aestuarii]